MSKAVPLPQTDGDQQVVLQGAVSALGEGTHASQGFTYFKWVSTEGNISDRLSMLGYWYLQRDECMILGWQKLKCAGSF